MRAAAAILATPVPDAVPVIDAVIGVSGTRIPFSGMSTSATPFVNERVPSKAPLPRFVLKFGRETDSGKVV